jgi:hypothetical protein
MGKVIARRVVELGSVICVVAGGPTGAIVASDWLPEKILNLSKKDFHLKNGCNFMGLDKNAPGSHSSKKPLFNEIFFCFKKMSPPDCCSHPIAYYISFKQGDYVSLKYTYPT